jgi:hypothetical protein
MRLARRQAGEFTRGVCQRREGGARAARGEQWRSSELGVVTAQARDRWQLASAPQSAASARKNDDAHTSSDFGVT